MEVTRDLIVLIKYSWKIIWNQIRWLPLLFHRQTIVTATNYGDVRGMKQKSIFGDRYYSFEGIPYAKPPLGKLRFREPEPVEPWQDVLNCTGARHKAMQRNFVFYFVEGSEDCLYLNIYVKQFCSAKKLPVIVWIHGGAFQIGEASRSLYGPDYFMRQDVVLVCIAYRLNVFGFLSFDDPQLNVPGNAGLKDQIMALEWIKDNIHHFNGDSNNITLYGNSAGSVSAHILMHCERARGLFHKAMLMSGTALCFWATSRRLNWGYRLARELGYTGQCNDRDVLEFLENADPRTMTKIENRILSKQERFEQIMAVFGPVIEPYTTRNAVITKPIIELVENAWGNEIPLLLSGTSDESLVLYAYVLRRPFLVNDLNNCEMLIPIDAQEHLTDEEKTKIGLKLKEMYFDNERPNFERHFRKYLKALDYYYFWLGNYRTIKSRLAYAPDAPTYIYRFSYDAPENHTRSLYCGRELRGASHSSELQYVFSSILSVEEPSSSLEYKISRTLMGLVIAFAKFSDPNCDEISPNVWKPVKGLSKEELLCLEIGENVKIIELPHTDQMRFWDSFYTK